MSKVSIKTITPVHVGSGAEYEKEADFIFFKQENNVAFIDTSKVLSIIGESNIGHWITCIENKESLLSLLKKRKSDLKSADVSSRTVTCRGEPTKPVIRVQIHSGNGKAMVPGSSLKGSIRTAVFSEKLLDSPELVHRGANLKDGNGRFKDAILIKSILGNDPYRDIFRLLQVGDVEFQKTEVIQTDVINKHFNNWRLKPEITQFIEAIPEGQSAMLDLKFNNNLLLYAGHYFNENANSLELDQLFRLTKEHTARLLEEEYNYWNDQSNPAELGEYTDYLSDLIAQVDRCNSNETILRLGWGTGFRNMTGDWHGLMSDQDYNDLLRKIRPNHSTDLVFPKTTRFKKGGQPLGFVKLTY